MRKKFGFTLIEVLIVVAIVAILVITLTFSVSRQRSKADDSRVKKDLHSLQVAFENYYNDHNCYPPASYFDEAADCGTNQLDPYLPQIPCDRATGMPYVLETDATTCDWYKLYARLRDPANDPEALELYSETGNPNYNYGVSSSNTSVSVYFPLASTTPSSAPAGSSSPTPTPTPSGSSNTYYCQGIGNCSLIPGGLTCTPNYNDPNCGTNHCASIVSTCN